MIVGPFGTHFPFVNGAPAPDGTQVEFLRNAGTFLPDNGTNEATVLTTGGQASITFGATEAGGYVVQARVKTSTSQITIIYRNPDTTGALQIYSINPAVGSYAGGETVVLTGKGIATPVEVFFTVQGLQYQAIVDQVVPSIPAESAGTITIRSPLPTAADPNQTSTADVRVGVRVGSSDEQSQTYPAAFTYISDSVIIGDPVIFGVEPYYGRSQGGETVTILGLNFAVDVTKELVKAFDEVYFIFEGQQLLAQVERWSANQIEVITPRFSLTPLTEDKNAGVLLTRTDGGDNVQKNDIFIVQTDIAEPEITGISPTAGPLDGGTIVTIIGHGFEIPVQVLFGNFEATDIQVFNDQSLGDNDLITCRSPDYSQQGETPPYSVEITVTNLATGNTTTSPQNFTYGDILYISQANPTEGQIGDLLTLYGAGFEDPLTVWFSGNIEFDVLAVTGTELTLRSPTSLAPTCADRTGNFRVVLNESNREATGGNYTLLGSNPTVTSVDPIFVDEVDNGNGVVPDDIDIYGVRFADEVLVLINNFTMNPDQVTVISSEHIEVSGIPAPNDFGLVFSTTSCTTGTGLQGIREVPTAVNVTVRNLPVGCENTLNQTLIYVPQDQTCVVAPVMNVNVPTEADFGIVSAGTCSLAQSLTISNNGAGTLEIQTLFLQGRFFFQAGFSQDAGPLTLPPFTSNNSLNLYFCPDVANGEQYLGNLVITSNNPGSPNPYPLRGTEGTPAPEIATSPAGDGDTWDAFADTANPNCSPTQALTISNNGTADLTLQSVTSSDDVQFHITNPPGANYVLAPTESYGLQVEFCPDNSGPGPRSGTLTIDHDATNAADPIVINFAGNAT